MAMNLKWPALVLVLLGMHHPETLNILTRSLALAIPMVSETQS